MKYASEFFPNNSTSGANFNIKNDTSVKEIIDNEYVNNNNLVDKYKVESLPTQIFVKIDKNKVIPVSRIEGYDFTKLKFEYNTYISN